MNEKARTNNNDQKAYIKILIALFNKFEINEVDKNDDYIPDKTFINKCSTLCLDFKTLSYNNCFDSCISKYVKTHIKFEEVNEDFIKKYKNYEVPREEVYGSKM
jgi:hypothetical protein